jgi:hypothetical protein
MRLRSRALALFTVTVASLTATDLDAQQMAPSRLRTVAAADAAPPWPVSLVAIVPSDTPSTPFPSAPKSLIASQIVGGTLAAVALGFGSWYLVESVDVNGRITKGDSGFSPNANLAYAVGSWAGASTISYFLGTADGSHASMRVTVLATGVATIPLFLGREEPYLPIIGIVLVAPLQSVFAAIGYQTTRRGPR